MNWLAFAGSLAAVLALAGIAWLLGLGRGERTTRIGGAEAAVRHAEDALAGFAAVAAVTSLDDRAGLVSSTDGRVAVLKMHGARVAVREVGWTAVRAAAGGIVVETGDRRFGRVTLGGVDALDVRRLAPAPAAIATQ